MARLMLPVVNSCSLPAMASKMVEMIFDIKTGWVISRSENRRIAGYCAFSVSGIACAQTGWGETLVPGQPIISISGQVCEVCTKFGND